MNPRQRILAAINHEKLDRFPTDIWAVQEVVDRLYEFYSVDSWIRLLDAMGIDGILGISPIYIGPPLPELKDGYRVDEWGMGYRQIAYPGGVYEEQVYFPLAEASSIADLEAFPWPSPDWYDYSTLSEQAIEKTINTERAIGCGYTAVFYWHNRLRGLELSLVDALERPEFTHNLIQRLSDFFTEYHRRCFEAGRGHIDLTQVTDDFGSQTNLLISPRTFDTFYRQPMQRAIDLAHEYQVIVFHHDDGDIRRLLPRLVEMDIQVLNPIQWRCGDWDLTALKRDFGEHFCFHGGVDNQETLPRGSAEDVRQEVRRLKRTLGADGTGLIIAPCHNIQAITPTENILAMYQTAMEPW
jgi:uroporphyrinogen decarboxylase